MRAGPAAPPWDSPAAGLRASTALKLLLSAALLVGGCTAADPTARPAASGPGAYTPIGQVGRPLGAISTDCRIDDNGLGATCRKLDRMPEGPITPIAAGQPRP